MPVKKNFLFRIVLFSLLVAILCLQHRFVYMYFDDYGYASLTYATDQFYNNGNQNLLTLLRYLGWHYLNWGGRILCFFAEICCLKAGLNVIRIAQALVIAGTLWFSAKLITPSKKDFPAALFLLLMFYLSLGQKTYQDGIFWFSASCSYLWPFLPLMAAVWLQHKYHENNSLHYLICADLLFFIAAFSQEQISVLVIIYTLLSTFLMRPRKKGILHYLCIPCSILGGAITILAPGNFVRAATTQYDNFYDLNLFEKIRYNFTYVVGYNIGSYNLIFSILLILVSIVFFIYQYQKRNHSLLSLILCVAEVILSVASIFAIWHYDFWQLPSLIPAFMWALVFSVEVLPFLYRNSIPLFALFIGGIFSQGMMLVSPTFSVRCHVPMAMALTVIAPYLLLMCISKRKAQIALSAIIFCMAMSTAIPIFLGYYRNSAVQETNHSILLETQEAALNNQTPDTVTLYKLPNDLYANSMPYHPTSEFISYWIKFYYKIPQTVTFEWQDP